MLNSIDLKHFAIAYKIFKNSLQLLTGKLLQNLLDQYIVTYTLRYKDVLGI